MVKTKRLETEYESSGTVRVNTAQCGVVGSKAGSRIPTEYDSGIIVKSNKPKSKSKY